MVWHVSRPETVMFCESVVVKVTSGKAYGSPEFSLSGNGAHGFGHHRQSVSLSFPPCHPIAVHLPQWDGLHIKNKKIMQVHYYYIFNVRLFCSIHKFFKV